MDLHFTSKFFGSTETFLNVDEIVITFNETPRLICANNMEIDLETVIHLVTNKLIFFFLFKELFFA